MATFASVFSFILILAFAAGAVYAMFKNSDIFKEKKVPVRVKSTYRNHYDNR